MMSLSDMAQSVRLCRNTAIVETGEQSGRRLRITILRPVFRDTAIFPTAVLIGITARRIAADRHPCGQHHSEVPADDGKVIVETICFHGANALVRVS